MSPVSQERNVALATADDVGFIRSNNAEILNELSEPLLVKLDDARSRKVTRDVLIAVAVTLLLRIPYFRGRMFPLNDGGMFAQIIDDIRASHFILPTHTTYNFLNIPLSYPPLAFYLGAVCAVLTGQSTVAVLTWLPLVLNLFTVIVVYFIARELYPSSFYACLAACCYASIGRSGEWLTMGGGLTRGLGILCALVAVLLFLRSRTRNALTLAAWSGLWVGLAILSHLEGGIFGALSIAVLSLLLPRRFQNIRLAILAAAVSVVTILPWIIWVYRHLGFGPLMNAAQTGGSYRAALNYYEVALLIASIFFAVVARFPYFCWLAVIPLALRRSGSTYSATVAGLSMVWFANAIVVILARRGAWVRARKSALLVVVAMALSLLINGIPHIRSDRLADLRFNSRAQLSRAELDGMEAAARLSPVHAKFFVFNQRLDDWPRDMVAEWFPYFAKRQCVNTVQGREWLPNGAFINAIVTSGAVEFSASQHATAMVLNEFNPDYIFVAGPFDEDHDTVANILRVYSGSSPIYKNTEVAIYKVERLESPISGTR